MNRRRFEITIQFEEGPRPEIHTDFLPTLAEARLEVAYWQKHHGPLADASIWDHTEKAYRALVKPRPGGID